MEIQFEFSLTEEKWYKNFEKYVSQSIPTGELNRDEWTPDIVYYSFSSDDSMDFYKIGIATATFYGQYETITGKEIN